MATIQASPVTSRHLSRVSTTFNPSIPGFTPLYIPGPGVAARTLFYWADFQARARDHAYSPLGLTVLRNLARLARAELRRRIPAHMGTDPEPYAAFITRAHNYLMGPVDLPEGMTPGPWVYGPRADIAESA